MKTTEGNQLHRKLPQRIVEDVCLRKHIVCVCVCVCVCVLWCVCVCVVCAAKPIVPQIVVDICLRFG